MNPYLETLGVILIAIAGVHLGKTFSKLKKHYWILGYLVPLTLILMLSAARFSSTLTFIPPFSYLMAGRTRFVVLAIVATIGITTPISRLPRKFERITVYVLMVIVVTWFSVLPFLVPALIKNKLLNTKTLLDVNGICYQTTDYTCGPAAAVTALGILGLQAEEGQLAVLAHTSPVAGTLPHCLSDALQNQFERQGLKSQYRSFDSIEQLKAAGTTLVVLSETFLLSHCVAVLDISDEVITLADPVLGKMLMSHDEFKQVWKYAGIVLKRDVTQNI
ncbi:MAG: hypothetical protein KAS75_01010 [Planctomycetes bacterium]|nr:hypothetical protein [Planctomycetota bacterium]